MPTTIAAKVKHVLAARQARFHTCHWPECTRQVPPAMWGCRPHWYALPPAIRARIWAAYKPGQEVTRTPSRDYIDAAKEADAFARAQNAKNPKLI